MGARTNGCNRRMAHGYLLSATYADGFVLSEDELDQSPYDEGRNIYHSIVNERAVEEHGPMIEFALNPDPQDGRERLQIDWTVFKPEGNPRAIYWRSMHVSVHEDGREAVPWCEAHFFGVQWLDEDGHNQQTITEIPGG